ncbi:MAG: aspartoacylase [Fibrobacterales bacterium]|nr:aspartoacylase [Fibrobacterales bacterium]
MSALTNESEEHLPVRTVAIVGGTHGNERSGAELVRLWTERPELVRRPGLEVSCFMGNPAAVEANRRYLERDLNRCFSPDVLAGKGDSLEERRARELNELIGPRGSDKAPDLCLDLHNTSSNMGLTVIFNYLDHFTRKLVAHLAANEPKARLYYQPVDNSTSEFLPSLGKHDLTIEAGPQHHGTLCADLHVRMEAMVHEMLDFCAAWNRPGFVEPPKRELEIFTDLKNIDYPRDENGRVSAMIHPGVDGMDYCELPAGAPLFLTFDGKIVWNPETESVWPLFVNEQAYYEKGVAMTLTKKSIVEW